MDKVRGLNESVKKGELLLILGKPIRAKGERGVNLHGALGLAIDMRASYPQ